MVKKPFYSGFRHAHASYPKSLDRSATLPADVSGLVLDDYEKNMTELCLPAQVCLHHRNKCTAIFRKLPRRT